MKKLVLFLAVGASANAMFLGCKGDTGPLGPTGNANVKTIQFTVSSSQWVVSGTNVVYFDKSMTQITQNVANSWTVLAYYQLTSGG